MYQSCLKLDWKNEMPLNDRGFQHFLLSCLRIKTQSYTTCTDKLDLQSMLNDEHYFYGCEHLENVEWRKGKPRNDIPCTKDSYVSFYRTPPHTLTKNHTILAQGNRHTHASTQKTSSFSKPPKLMSERCNKEKETNNSGRGQMTSSKKINKK